MNRHLAAAVIATFRTDDPGLHGNRLERFTVRDWKRSLHWLDASGLALYFLNRIKALEIEQAIPISMRLQLEQRYTDNKQRTASLWDEFVRLNRAFQAAGLQYVNLKGFTLKPDYCADLALRYQLDSDFLAARTDAACFREILRSLGYSLTVADDHVLEFKAGWERIPGMRDLYKPKPQKSVEVHLEPSLPAATVADAGSLLKRARLIELEGAWFPALSASDMFVAQASHLFRHLRSEWTRACWLLEFRNCATRKQFDQGFWDEAQAATAGNRDSQLALAVAIYTTARAFGDCGNRAWLEWSERTIPPAVRGWIHNYGEAVMLSDYPGSKLYLLLEQALGEWPKRAGIIRRRVLPLRLPLAVAAAPHGNLRKRMLAARFQCQYFFFRLRFHVVEGARYLLEAWRSRRMAQATSSGNPEGPNPATLDSLADPWKSALPADRR